MIANIPLFSVRTMVVLKCIQRTIKNIRKIASFSHIIVSFVKNLSK